MSGFGHSGHGSDIRRGGVGVVSGRRVFGSPAATSQVHAARAGLLDLAPSAGVLGSRPWGLSDPEKKRKKRVAKYKVYGVEGKVKASMRKGIRWIKNKCSLLVHGC